MAWQDPAEYWARLQEEAKRNTGKDIELEYMLRTLAMKKVWQFAEEHNISMFESATIDIYIPPTTKSIDKVLLRIRLKPFEYYVQYDWPDPTSQLAGWTETATWQGTVDPGEAMLDAGYHSHGGAVELDGSHNHAMYDHKHKVQAPMHRHNKTTGVFRGLVAQNISVEINGIDRTSELGGPFSENLFEIDVTPYMEPIGFNTITFRTTTKEGRIRIVPYIEIYSP